MKEYGAWVKFKDGSPPIFVRTHAKDADEARTTIERSQFRRSSEERQNLTFARLNEAKETGKPGLLAIDPRLSGKALTEAWVKAETERRKKDLARYDKGFTVEKVTET